MHSTTKQLGNKNNTLIREHSIQILMLILHGSYARRKVESYHAYAVHWIHTHRHTNLRKDKANDVTIKLDCDLLQ